MLKFNIFVFYLFLLGTTYFVNSLPKFSRSSDRVTNEELDELEKLLVEKLKREELRRPIKETELLDEEQNLNDKREFQSLEKFLRKKDKYLREYGKERERVYESAGKRLDRQNMLQKFNVREEEVMDETKRYSVVDKNSQDTIDVSKVDPSSHLANELEGMEIEVNGKVHLVQGLHPENSQKAKANSMDKHLYTQDQLHNLLPNNKRGYKRNFDKTATLWEKGIVPYVMYNMSRWAIPVINTGIQQINNNTCVKWIEKDKVTENLSHSNVVYIINEGGCWSYVGSVFTRQYLSLSEPGCISVSTAVHEMLHAMGGHHEQSRSDRDEYVTIDFSNVRGGTRNINMRKFNTYDNNPYDAESSMQYSLYAFSMNSQKTIFFKDQRLEFLANSADGLEFYDMADVTKAYNCTDHCSTKPNCQNGGFVNFRCECVCPNSLSGPLCETPVSKGNCGGIINIGLGETKYIESPNFSSGGNYPYGLNCTWLIKGVPGNRIRASVQSMDVTSSNVCNHWIEYRYNLLGQRGPRICGTNNVADSEIWDTTKDELQHVMIIKFNSESNIGAQGRGFQIKLNNIGTGCDNHRCMYGKCTSPEGTNTYTCICDSGMSGPYCDQFSPYAVITAGFEFGEKNIFGQVSTDQFDWSIRSGSTSSSDTGPNRAKEGFQYTYIETSSPRKEGDRATMETSGIFSDIERCMRFWYHMHGSHIGTLSVYTEGTGVSRTIQFNLKGDQGNSWNNAFFNIPSMPNLKVTIEATRGSGYKGDIAIDDVKFIPGSCDNPVTSGPITPQPTTQPRTSQGTTTQPNTTQPTTTQLTTTQPMTTQPNTTQPTTTQRTTTQPTATKATTLQPTAGPVTDEVCDFETDAACFLVEDQNDDQDWTVRSGSTPSSGTGPSSAYEGNRYKYMEMSSPVQNGDVATLVSSNALHAGSSYCLTFAYHMHGSTSMGSLKVGTGSNSLTNSLLSMKGTQGDQWHNAVVDITGTAGHKLFISANRCTTWKGDIAIDDVRLTNQRCSNVIDPCDSSPCQNYGSCEVYGSDYVCRCPAGFSGKNCEAEDGAAVTEFVCTFESGENCVFEDDVNDDFDWTPRSGPTPSGRTGPSSAYKGTQYIYMEASSPRAPGDTAVLSTRTTKLRTQYNYCLSFFYHMLVTNGILRVTAAERTDATQSELFSLSGNQGNQWIFAFVSIPNTYSDLVVSIEGIRQSSWKGDIAIDNIILLQGDCSGMICRYNPCMNGGTCTASGTSYTCSCATGYAGVNCTGQDTSNLDYMECTFETGTQCIFQDSTNDEFDWTKKSGGTPSRNTGPSGAGEGSKYMYIETSSPRVSGDTAVLTTENSRLASGYAYCLQFMYHMKITSGTLQVYAGDVTAIYSLWERSGTQLDEDNWQTASVDIPASNNPVIEIVGTRGSSYRGDIAIDEIQLNRRQCPTRK